MTKRILKKTEIESLRNTVGVAPIVDISALVAEGKPPCFAECNCCTACSNSCSACSGPCTGICSSCTACSGCTVCTGCSDCSAVSVTMTITGPI